MSQKDYSSALKGMCTMSKYVLRDGVIFIKSNKEVLLYDIYRRKMMLLQMSEDDFLSILTDDSNTQGYRLLILQSLLKRNYIVNADNGLFSIFYETEFCL